MLLISTTCTVLYISQTELAAKWSPIARARGGRTYGSSFKTLQNLCLCPFFVFVFDFVFVFVFDFVFV